MFTPKQAIGHGLYSVREAAMYARVSRKLLNRWLFGDNDGRPAIDPEFGPDAKFVSFLDLIQSLAVRDIRIQKGVPLPKIREAIRFARDHLSFDHPFARRHATFLNRDGEIVIQPAEGEFVQATGRQQGQMHFRFVHLYLNDLTFGPEGLATRYTVFRHKTSAGVVEIRMDPGIRFGEPLTPSGFTPMALYEAIIVEGGIEPAADAYAVPVAEVEAAYDFVSSLGKAA